MDLALSKLKKGTSTVFAWFQNNYLKANSWKYLLATSDNVLYINVRENQLSSRKFELLRILIDHKLTFENHLLNIVPKITKKLHAVARKPTYTSQKKLKIIMKVFDSSQFAYCSLFWMFYSRKMNPNVN